MQPTSVIPEFRLDPPPSSVASVSSVPRPKGRDLSGAIPLPKRYAEPLSSSSSAPSMASAALLADGVAQSSLMQRQQQKFAAWKNYFGSEIVDRYVPVQDQTIFSHEEMKALFEKIHYCKKWESEYGSELVQKFVPLDLKAKIDPSWIEKQLANFEDEEKFVEQDIRWKNRPKASSLFEDAPVVKGDSLTKKEIESFSYSPEAFTERATVLRKKTLQPEKPDSWNEAVYTAAHFLPLSDRVEFYRTLQEMEKNANDFRTFIESLDSPDPETLQFLLQTVFPHYASGEIALTEEVKKEIEICLKWMPDSRVLGAAWRRLLNFDKLDSAHRPPYNIDVWKNHLRIEQNFQKFLQAILERSARERLSIKAKRDLLILKGLSQASYHELHQMQKALPESAEFINKTIKKAFLVQARREQLFFDSINKRAEYLNQNTKEIEELHKRVLGYVKFVEDNQGYHEKESLRFKELSAAHFAEKIAELRGKIARGEGDLDDLEAQIDREEAQLKMFDLRRDVSNLPQKFAKESSKIYVRPLGDILYRTNDDSGTPYVEGRWMVADLRDVKTKNQQKVLDQLNTYSEQQEFKNLKPGEPLYFDLDKEGRLVKKEKSGAIVLFYLSPKEVVTTYGSRELGAHIRIKKENGVYKYVQKPPGDVTIQDSATLTASVDSQIAILMERELISRFMDGKPPSFKVYQNTYGHILTVAHTELAKETYLSDPLFRDTCSLNEQMMRPLLERINQASRISKSLQELEMTHDPSKNLRRIKGIAEAIRLYHTWAGEIDAFLKGDLANLLREPYARNFKDVLSLLPPVSMDDPIDFLGASIVQFNFNIEESMNSLIEDLEKALVGHNLKEAEKTLLARVKADKNRNDLADLLMKLERLNSKELKTVKKSFDQIFDGAIGEGELEPDEIALLAQVKKDKKRDDLVALLERLSRFHSTRLQKAKERLDLFDFAKRCVEIDKEPQIENVYRIPLEEQLKLIDTGLQYISSILKSKESTSFQAAVFALSFYKSSKKFQEITATMISEFDPMTQLNFQNMLQKSLQFPVWTGDLLKALLGGATELSREFIPISSKFNQIQEDLRLQELLQSHMKQALFSQVENDPSSAMAHIQSVKKK
ncbi:MAG: hypothetical protein JSS32_03695 [Verrucomicrobia bacterium]|nr:hypothetical protein [Verrucomicrobiota bacterium]